MIQILQVLPQGREARPFMKGWGAIHWAPCLPLYVLCIGIGVLFATAYGWAYEEEGRSLRILIITLAIFVLWAMTTKLSEHVYRKANKSAPSSGLPCDWTLDQSGIAFSSALASSRTNWEAIKAVREESDRIIILLSPSANPILPKRQLTDEQLSAIRALVDEVTASGRLGAGVD